MAEKDTCHVERVEKAVSLTKLEESTVAYLAVGGMGCPNCALRVRNGLLTLEGVYQAEVYLEDRIAEVTFDPQVNTVEDLVDAVIASGNDGKHRYWAQVLPTH